MHTTQIRNLLFVFLKYPEKMAASKLVHFIVLNSLEITSQLLVSLHVVFIGVTGDATHCTNRSNVFVLLHSFPLKVLRTIPFQVKRT